MTLISAFEVPVDADESFLAGWKRARAALGVAVLHRAWRPDVKFRFVITASLGNTAAPDLGFAAHAGVYEVIHEDGEPDGAQGVILINPIEVPSADEDGFITGWTRVRDLLERQRGYLGTRLHRAVDEPADLRFVNIARWSSPLMFSRATQQPDIRDATQAMPFPSHPAMYQIIDECPRQESNPGPSD